MMVKSRSHPSHRSRSVCYQLCLKMPQSVPKCLSREFLRGSKFKICGPSLCQKPSTTSRSSPLKSHSLATVSSVFYFSEASEIVTALLLWQIDTHWHPLKSKGCIDLSFTSQNFSQCSIARGCHKMFIISHIYVWTFKLTLG